MIGVESRKLKRTAASRVILQNKPAVMVEPDLETPGTRANACATPTTSESASEIRLSGFSRLPIFPPAT